MTMTDTTLRVSKEVRDELAKLGSKEDSFDAILRRLLERSEEGAELTPRKSNPYRRGGRE
jgi:predicted CopG family antitoxin